MIKRKVLSNTKKKYDPFAIRAFIRGFDVFFVSIYNIQFLLFRQNGNPFKKNLAENHAFLIP